MKLHDYGLHPTTGLKPPLQILFWKCSKGKGSSKISKTTNNFGKAASSSLALQACNLEFQASAKQLQEKSFLLVF